MRQYKLSMADSINHHPEHPERTAYKLVGWDYFYQVWNSAASLKKTIEMQENRAFRSTDWRPCDREAMDNAVLASIKAHIAKLEKETAVVVTEVS